MEHALVHRLLLESLQFLFQFVFVGLLAKRDAGNSRADLLAEMVLFSEYLPARLLAYMPWLLQKKEVIATYIVSST